MWSQLFRNRSNQQSDNASHLEHHVLWILLLFWKHMRFVTKVHLLVSLSIVVIRSDNNGIIMKLFKNTRKMFYIYNLNTKEFPLILYCHKVPNNLFCFAHNSDEWQMHIISLHWHLRFTFRSRASFFFVYKSPIFRVSFPEQTRDIARCTVW